MSFCHLSAASGAGCCSVDHTCAAALQAIWAKGYTELLDLVEKDHTTSETYTAIDCYGYGDDLHEVRPPGNQGSVDPWRLRA